MIAISIYSISITIVCSYVAAENTYMNKYCVRNFILKNHNKRIIKIIYTAQLQDNKLG
jgi:hypothetical protein